MKLGYVYMSKIGELLEKRHNLKIRLERIDTLLDRQAYHSISNSDVDSLNEEYDEIEDEISKIDDSLEMSYKQLQVIIGIIEKDIKELIKEDKDLNKRMDEIYATIKSPNKSYMNTYEINSLIKEYNMKKARVEEIAALIEKGKHDFEVINKFLSKTELPKRRMR